MHKNYMLKTDFASAIYEKTKDLPIIDYHCHLSPKEIFEDKPFDNIGEMWLGGDHYKWRLMRTAGIDEKYITGDADWREKFIKYAAALEYAAGNPLYHWSHMELSMFFGIDKALKSDNAAEIYDEANAYIAENRLSPRKLIEQSRTEVICTTDDIIDTLEYHKKIREDKSFKTHVLPSFRTDNLLLVRREGYGDYIKKLADISGTEISDLEGLKKAVIKRLDFFCLNGCRFTDVGIPYFPDRISDSTEADVTFKRVLAGAEISDTEYSGFIGNMYLFLAAEYKKRSLVMQMHLAVYRNANSNLFAALGADCGVDCVGDEISGTALIHMLDAINKNSGMPKSITAFCNTGKFHSIEVEDEATIYAEYENGATGVFITSTGDCPGTNRLEITGTRGKIVLENGILKLWKLKEDERDICKNSVEGFVSPETEYSEFTAEKETAHAGILKNFADAILYGEELLSPGYDGINELMISNAAYLSEWTGNKRVTLPFDTAEFDRLLAEKQRNSKYRADTSEKSGNASYLPRWQVRW